MLTVRWITYICVLGSPFVDHAINVDDEAKVGIKEIVDVIEVTVVFIFSNLGLGICVTHSEVRGGAAIKINNKTLVLCDVS